jgi:hypothetical protein
MIIKAAAGFQKSQVGSEVARNVRDTDIGASLEIGNIIAGAKRDLYMNAGNTSAAKIDQGVNLVNAMIPPEFPIARGLVEIPKYDAITKRNRTANEATSEFSADTVQNREWWYQVEREAQDDGIVRYFISRDPHWLKVQFPKHVGRMRTTALAILRNPDDAEDAVEMVWCERNAFFILSTTLQRTWTKL